MSHRKRTASSLQNEAVNSELGNNVHHADKKYINTNWGWSEKCFNSNSHDTYWCNFAVKVHNLMKHMILENTIQGIV